MYYNKSSTEHIILCKISPDDRDIIEIPVSFGSIYEYSSVEVIEQNINQPLDLNFNEAKLLETYEM